MKPALQTENKNSQRAAHLPVMLPEVLEALAPIERAVVVDGTFGAGGYSRAILDRNPRMLVAIDRDENSLSRFGFEGKNVKLCHGPFGDIGQLLNAISIDQVDSIVVDLGVSSMQLDEAERGFSFQANGPLDMRMDQSQGQTAADLVNEEDEADLATIFWRYGEEKRSRQVAKAIVATRDETPFQTTAQLADLVRSVVKPNIRKKGGGKMIDPATRVFQALRIKLNDELGELERLLEQSIHLLSAGGRLVVVSFHSLEDRIVKQFLNRHGAQPNPSRYQPVQEKRPALFDIVSKRAIGASDAEIEINPRARSAKMRVGIRTSEQGQL